jgi:hypothetical protein
MGSRSPPHPQTRASINIAYLPYYRPSYNIFDINTLMFLTFLYMCFRYDSTNLHFLRNTK